MLIDIDKAAQWETAPNLMDMVEAKVEAPIEYGIEYWIKNVAQGTLLGLDNGYKIESSIPEFMRENGPLRDALIKEMAFRSRTETFATRGLCELAAISSNVNQLDFFVTQIMDEARHAHIFRNHILDLGVELSDLEDTMDFHSKHHEEAILKPINEWAMAYIRDERYFHGGVAIITILLEGVLAPAAALSELKWRPLNPRVADIEKGANIDELRHLNVGAKFIKDYLEKNPGERNRLLNLIVEGRDKWASLPVQEMVFERESLFQEGMKNVKGLIGEYELCDGVRLVDTTAESRMELSFSWSQKMQESRLIYMGLSEAVG